MQTEPTLTEPKKSTFNIVKIILNIFLVMALLAFLGLGYWAYSLNAKLNATLADQSALQSRYDTLTQDKNTLANNLDTTKADLERARKDLEKSNQDLAAEQANLTKAQEEQTTLQGKIDSAVKYLDVAIGYWVDDVSTSALGKRVETVGDTDLTTKFERWSDDKTSNRWLSWMTYIFVTVNELLTTN